MWHTGERSNLSSDICQWLRAPSVNNQSQNAPSVIPRILLVCLPGNRLGNQHGNHIWDPVLYLWMIACPHLINCILPGVYYQFKIILKSAFNKQAHHKVLYGVTEGINAEEKLSKRRTKVIWLSLYYFLTRWLLNHLLFGTGFLWRGQNYKEKWPPHFLSQDSTQILKWKLGSNT